jgi:hypothetical protein
MDKSRSIYVIKSTEGEKLYVGFTTQDLQQRLFQHALEWSKNKIISEMKLEGQFKVNPTKSFIIFDKYPMPTISICLLEEVGDDHKERENYWIDYFGEEAVNVKKAFITDVHLGIQDPKERFKVWQKAYVQLPHVKEKRRAINNLPHVKEKKNLRTKGHVTDKSEFTTSVRVVVLCVTGG